MTNPPATTPSVDATFVFVDLAGFTALTEAHGDAEAVALLDRFEAIATDALGSDDRLVKTIGDAVMLAFPGPEAAIAATARLFTALADTDLPVARAGLHHGSAIEHNGDYLGASVNLTARVAGQAHGAQVLATTEVADAARRQGVTVVDLGCFELRHITERVELYQLEVCPSAAGSVIDPVCRMQVPRASAAGRLRHQDRDYWFCSLQCAAAFAADPDRLAGHPR
ncbi:MAG: adenylate/guanylate cyclase domain-containing protein [Acidimicrobiales bacterium]